MPKFFNAKDLDFIKTISEEVVDYVVEQAVTLFKVSVGETKTNLYGESLGKVWKAPSTVMAIVDREPANVVYEGFGADKQQAVEFRFNRQRLRETSYSVPKVRDINGATNPAEALPGTIRYLYGIHRKGPDNAVHSSDGPKSAEREINIFGSI